MAPTALRTDVTDALSVLVACQVKRNWPDGPATSMRVPPSVVDFLDVTVPLVARASVNGVSTVNAKEDDVDRGQLSGSVVSAPSRRSGTIRLSDNVAVLLLRHLCGPRSRRAADRSRRICRRAFLLVARRLLRLVADWRSVR